MTTESQLDTEIAYWNLFELTACPSNHIPNTTMPINNQIINSRPPKLTELGHLTLSRIFPLLSHYSLIPRLPLMSSSSLSFTPLLITRSILCCFFSTTHAFIIVLYRCYHYLRYHHITLSLSCSLSSLLIARFILCYFFFTIPAFIIVLCHRLSTSRTELTSCPRNHLLTNTTTHRNHEIILVLSNFDTTKLGCVRIQKQR